ncbi:hypothetical protein HK102_012582 [Quaeritorhiza haematococci]|nr:hypothetical protein HK102_012582 [Quaeritorhiza haematococci]
MEVAPFLNPKPLSSRIEKMHRRVFLIHFLLIPFTILLQPVTSQNAAATAPSNTPQQAPTADEASPLPPPPNAPEPAETNDPEQGLNITGPIDPITGLPTSASGRLKGQTQGVTPIAGGSGLPPGVELSGGCYRVGGGSTGVSLCAQSGVDTDDTPAFFEQTGQPYFLLNQGGKGPSEGAVEVANALAALRPTFVRGLIKLGSADFLFGTHVTDFAHIRRVVRAASPGCIFDLELDGLEYASGTGQRLVNKLKYIQGLMKAEDGFKFDVIFFDHWNQAYKKNPPAMLLGMRYIHYDMKMPVGGNTYGGPPPPYTDFVGATTLGYNIPPQSTPFNIPVIGQLLNSASLDMVLS